MQITTCVSPSGTLISTTALLDSFSPDQKCLAYDAPGGPFQLDGRAIVYQGMRYELSTEIFPGRHLLVNLQAALTALQCTGISIPDAIASLASFEPLPHRLTPVGTMNGVHFIDDSISTIPESAAAAVDSLAPRPCILILGGFDRGRDWHSVVPDLCARSVKAVVCTGQNGPRIAAAFAAHGESGAAIPAVSCEQEFDAAVAAACRKAAAGDVVLLSPGSPSYDRFTSYIERGNAFRRLTQELSGGCC